GSDTFTSNLVFTISQLQAINSNLAGNYALAQDIDATGFTGYVPIGSGASPYSGTFNGLGNVVANLTISTNGSFAGLFGRSSGTIKNVGLVGGSVTDTAFIAGAAGGLVGTNQGQITNSFSTTPVTDNSQNGNVGGLVGFNTVDGHINNSYATGAVS